MFGFAKNLHELREQEEREDRMRLQSLSEKELLVEILLELKKVNHNCNDIARKIVLWHN